MLLFCSEELTGNALRDFVKQPGGATNAFFIYMEKIKNFAHNFCLTNGKFCDKI